MAKSTCLIALFVAVVVCAEAIRIDVDTSESTPSGDKHIRKNDPRCKGKPNGLYPIPGECKRFLKCVRGHSRVRKCPRDFEFDSIRYCVPPGSKPDCRKPRVAQSDPLNGEIKCKESWGMFPLESDCHKYILCIEGIPEIKKCPPKMHYRNANGACIEGDKCTKQSSEGVYVCQEPDQYYAHEKNCRKYIKCVNSKPEEKECDHGTAFDPVKLRCTENQFDKCKNNDILSVEPDE